MQGNLQTQKHIWIWSHLATQWHHVLGGFVSFDFFKGHTQEKHSKPSSSKSSSMTFSLRLWSHFLLWSPFLVTLFDTLSESFLQNKSPRADQHSNTYRSWSTSRKRRESKAPLTPRIVVTTVLWKDYKPTDWHFHQQLIAALTESNSPYQFSLWPYSKTTAIWNQYNWTVYHIYN